VSKSTDPAWFQVAVVSAVDDAPCSSTATPSRDGSQCYELNDALFDAAGVEVATAVEDPAPGCEPAPGEEFCVDTGMGSTTQPGLGTWSVRFTVTANALGAFNGVAESCTLLEPPCPTGQIAIVVDGEVVSAPTVHATQYERDAFVLSGEFDRATAERIATRLSG
jgi:hypothetical protein